MTARDAARAHSPGTGPLAAVRGRPLRASATVAHEYTPVAGTLVHAAAVGPKAAPEVVCVPGLGMSHRYFLPFARALAPARRVVAVDLPGFGHTPGPSRALGVRGLSHALADWLRTTGRAGAPLVANSLGCQVVVDMATHAAELVGPTVLNGPTIDPGSRTMPAQVARLVANIPREPVGLLALAAWEYLACGPLRILRTFQSALADPVERKLPGFPAPAMVVRGSFDTLVPPAWAAECARLLPRAHLVEVPGFGHAVNYAAPQTLALLTLLLLEG